MAAEIRARRRAHAFPLAASAPHDLSERWVDFTSQDAFPKSYLEESRWKPICRLDANHFDRLMKHYAAWIMRDQAGKA